MGSDGMEKETVFEYLDRDIADYNRRAKNRKRNRKKRERKTEVKKEYKYSNEDKYISVVKTPDRRELLFDGRKTVVIKQPNDRYRVITNEGDHTFGLKYIGRPIVEIDNTLFPLSYYDLNISDEEMPSLYYIADIIEKIALIGTKSFMENHVFEGYNCNRPEIDLYFFKREDCYFGFELDYQEFICVKENDLLYILYRGKKVLATEIAKECSTREELTLYVKNNPNDFKRRILELVYGKCLKSETTNGVNKQYYANAVIQRCVIEDENDKRRIQVIYETKTKNVEYTEVTTKKDTNIREVEKNIYDSAKNTLTNQFGRNKIEFNVPNASFQRILEIIDALKMGSKINYGYAMVRLIISLNTSDFCIANDEFRTEGKIGEIDGTFILKNGEISFKSKDSSFDITRYTLWSIFGVCDFEYAKGGKVIKLIKAHDIHSDDGNYRVSDPSYYDYLKKFQFYLSCAKEAFALKYGEIKQGLNIRKANYHDRVINKYGVNTSLEKTSEGALWYDNVMGIDAKVYDPEKDGGSYITFIEEQEEEFWKRIFEADRVYYERYLGKIGIVDLPGEKMYVVADLLMFAEGNNISENITQELVRLTCKYSIPQDMASFIKAFFEKYNKCENFDSYLNDLIKFINNKIDDGEELDLNNIINNPDIAPGIKLVRATNE